MAIDIAITALTVGSTDNSSYDNYAIIVYSGDISKLYGDRYSNHSPDSRSTDNSSYDNYAIIVYSGDISKLYGDRYSNHSPDSRSTDIAIQTIIA